jgi:hypothetical protein
MLVRRLCIALLLVLAALTARADQAEWVSKPIAEAAEKALEMGVEIRHFCPLCGDEAYRREVVADKFTQEVDAPDRFSLFVNGNPVDLAYVYFEKDGKWSNLGMAVGATVDSVPEVLPAELQQTLADFDRVLYRGTIGENLVIFAELSKFDREINGSYYYSHVGQRLNLRGTFDSLGEFTIDETGENDEKTGTFVGKLTEKGAKAEGTWSNADGSKKLPFTLSRIAFHGEDNGAIIVAMQATETHLDFPVLLPSFGPAYNAVNEKVQAILREAFNTHAIAFTTSTAEFAAENETLVSDGEPSQSIYLGDHQVFLANSAAVSILFRVSLYQGGAHDITTSQPINLRLSKAGDTYKAEPIALGELLAPGPDALAKLSARLIQGLKEKNASQVADGTITAFKAEDLAAFTLSPRGIIVYFDPYSVGAYAEGAFDIAVPFADLPDVFNTAAVQALIAPAK